LGHFLNVKSDADSRTRDRQLDIHRRQNPKLAAGKVLFLCRFGGNATHVFRFFISDNMQYETLNLRAAAPSK
jgi:hypothetical protein